MNDTLEAPAVDAGQMAEWMDSVNDRLREMAERIVGLQAQLAGAQKPDVNVKPTLAAAAPTPAVKEDEEVPPEILLVISAAIAAFMGKRARIRRVRRVPPGLNPWSQQGRVNIQGSHNVR